MLTLQGKRFSNCTGLTRRNLLQIGIPALGLSLEGMLAASARVSGNNHARGGKSIIVFWTDGGISQQDTWDLKPEAPVEYRGMYKAIESSVPGLVLGERLPYQSRMMHKMSIVRSVHHENGIHAPSAHWMLTGHFGPTLARNAPQKPAFGSVIARTLGSLQPPMPPYITIPRAEAFGYQGAVYLGKAFNPFEVGGDPSAKNFKVSNLSLPVGLNSKNVESRRDLVKQFDSLRRDIYDSSVMEGLDTFKAQALDMVAGDRMRAAFDLSAESPRLRDRYGHHRYGQSALLARRLVEGGARCVNINTGNWDHHNDIAKGLETHLPPLDQAIATLVDDLDQRGMLDDVIVYCVGEFGRTPRMNGNAGRDHWADCFSVLLAGGGIAGGLTVGASEKWGGSVAQRLVTPQDLLATIYHLLGIPLETNYLDTSGRPVPVTSGSPVSELFA